MTFEEFFKKKKIDVAALEEGDAGLFSEFKIHFEQMGDKSFDHSKKYWFNKLRRQFPLAPEVKIEKPAVPEAQTEQSPPEKSAETVAAPPAAKMGFVPKFRAGNMPKPVVSADEKKEEPSTPAVTENTEAEKPAESTEVKPAYKPRFNMKSIPPKPPEE
ncbi:MAG: hypothetical protein ACHQIM_05180 [Sphingobacteriales bacterium]